MKQHPEHLPTFRPLLAFIAAGFQIATIVLTPVGLVWLAPTVFLLGVSLRLSTLALSAALLVLAGTGILTNGFTGLLLPGAVLAGHQLRQLLLHLEWSLAERDFLSRITDYDRVNTPHNALKESIQILRELSRADAVIVLHQLDHHTAEVAMSYPPDVLNDVSLKPSIYREALETGQSIYYEDYVSEQSADQNLIAAGVRALAILPGSHSEDLSGAILIMWHQAQPIPTCLREAIKRLANGLHLLLHFQFNTLHLAQTQSRLDAILNTIHQGVVFVDEQGKEAWLNKVAAAELGLQEGVTNPAIVAAKMADLRMNVDNPESVNDRLTDFYLDPQGTKIRDWYWVFTEPQRKVLNVSTMPGRSYGLSGRLWIFEDVTEAYFIRQELHESELRYRILAEYATDVISLHARDGTYTYVSPAAEALLGYKPEELLGHDPYEFFHPDDVRPYHESFIKAVSAGETHTGVFRVQHRAGHYLWAETMSQAVKDGRTVSISRDITERRQIEEERLQILFDREQARILSDFVRNMSHEFRTPLSTLSTGLYLLARTEDADNRALRIAKLRNQVNAIEQLVDDLLIMAQLDRRDEMDSTVVNINEMLEELHRVFIPRAEAQQQTIVLHEMPNNLKVDGDYDLLCRAVINILENALDYTPEAGQVEISAHEEDDYITMKFRDNGKGINEEEQTRIFNRFYRGDLARSTRGSGLGLSIVQKIIHAHNGTINVESQLNHGSTFIIHLPIAQQADPTSQETSGIGCKLG